ncbi:DUF3866 family protein [Brevibacillus migulae]|uniref:DUF3866 family protein n=1 Tax=Brevibacillus migulae TaxID=1644114 RepID=UPI00106E12C5|nr:DUF3866 family protein [Brevibacillus migulae]
MLRVAAAKVVEIQQEQDGWQLLEIEQMQNGERGLAICYWKGSGKCGIGDKVTINTTAVELGLGTGGCHFVIGKLSETPRDDYYPNAWGHIMKMRYTSVQMAVDAVEEQSSPYHDLFIGEQNTLQGTPVLIAELHSLLPIFALAARQRKPEWNIVYLMPDGAALPIAISQHVRKLREMKVLNSTITTGHAWGGDFEAVNVYTGLLAAKWAAKADLIICTLGPGVVGTGTTLGFSGMQLAEVIHAVSLLAGIPVFTPRISFADRRDRHRGMSHHSRTLLKRFSLRPAILPIPRFGDERDELLELQEAEDRLREKHGRIVLPAPELHELEILQDRYEERISTMGRKLAEDPSPFQAAYLSVQVAMAIRNTQQEFIGEMPDLSDPATLTRLCSYLTNGEG